MYKIIILFFFLLFILFSCSEKLTESEEQPEDNIITQFLYVQETNGNRNIGIIDSDGKNKNIILNQVDAHNLRFSTDGKKITFENRNDQNNIYMVDSDGTNSTIILEDLWGVYDVKLLSQKNIMIIAAFENDGSSSIYYWDISNNIRTKIVDHESNMEYIAVSPDENQIFYISKYDGAYLMNWDGENRREFQNGWCANPISYSTDGSKLLYSIGDIIYTTNSVGENIFAVTNDSMHAEYPAFSPEGTKIVFSNNYSGFSENKLCQINPDGMDLKSIYSSSEHRILSPQFTYDGLKIVFKMNNNLYSINLDGTDLHQLVADIYYAVIKPLST